MMSVTGEFVGIQRVDAAGAWRRTVTLTGAMTVLFLALLGAATLGEPTAVSVAPSVIASLGPITSHNGRMIGEVVEAPQATSGTGESDRWIVRLRTRAGVPVVAASVQVTASLPELGRIEAVRAARYLGDGRYQIDSVSLGRPGWWNVALVVRARAVTDSLAFNLVVPTESGGGSNDQ